MFKIQDQERRDKPRLLISGDLLQLYLVSEPLSRIASGTTPGPLGGGTDGAPRLALGLAELGDPTALGLATGGTATTSTMGHLEPSLLRGHLLFFNLQIYRVLTDKNSIIFACIPGRTHPPRPHCDGIQQLSFWGRNSSSQE